MAASALTVYNPYKSGASLSHPVVMKSPFTNWRALCVRVKVKTAFELFLGGFCELADSGTPKVVEKTADKSEKAFAIIPDILENRNQLQIDNSGIAITKLLFFNADSYIWVLPLIPGFVLSVRLKASVEVCEIGDQMCTTVDGDGRTMEQIGTDEQPIAVIGRNIGGDNTNGTGVQYVAMAVR